MNYLLPERLDRLARAYALGTLAGPARRRFDRVLRSSPAASVAVDVWRQRLSILDLAVVPMQPPSRPGAASSGTCSRRAAPRPGAVYCRR